MVGVLGFPPIRKVREWMGHGKIPGASGEFISGRNSQGRIGLLPVSAGENFREVDRFAAA